MINIEQLRKDVALTAEREGWSREETLEIGTEIRKAIEAGDEEALAGWAEQMAWWREMLASTAPAVRAAEHRIRVAADLARRKAA